MQRTHWYGETVESIDTTLDALTGLLPAFDRYGLGNNRLYDVIVRRGDVQVPVGTVSKRYTLVQHADAVAAVTDEIRKEGIAPRDVPVRLLISEYGTRIALRAVLPDEFAVTPPDGHPMALTFECFNSVDGSVPLMAAVGWFRFVCSNGMVVGTTAAKVRQRHSPSLDLERISTVLAEGVVCSINERKAFRAWHDQRLDDAALVKWVDGPVAATWGALAAARVFGIARSGRDGKPGRIFEKIPPHRRGLTDTFEVPGAEAPCRTAYAAAQVLAWIATTRPNVAERLEWRSQIPMLMAELTAAA